MKMFGLKALASLLAVLLVGTLLATSVFAAPPSPTPRANPNDGSRGSGWMMGGYNLNGVAKSLGTTTADLYTQLRQGKTLLEIAGADKEQQLIDILVAPYSDQLKLRVKYEYLTQDQAEALLVQANDRAKAFVNGTASTSTVPGSCGGFGGSAMGGLGGMMGGLGGMMSGFGGMMGGLGRW